MRHDIIKNSVMWKLAFKLNLDFFDPVDVVDRCETLDTRDADDLRDDKEIKSGAICLFDSNIELRYFLFHCPTDNRVVLSPNGETVPSEKILNQDLIDEEYFTRIYECTLMRYKFHT